jgi:hypothetical protein
MFLRFGPHQGHCSALAGGAQLLLLAPAPRCSRTEQQ